MDSRSEFERAVKSKWSDSYIFNLEESDRYVDEILEAMFWAWQASRQALSSCSEIPNSSDPASCPEIPDSSDHDNSQALDGEATGTLTVDHHKNNPAMQNVDYEHAGDVLKPGIYKLYTHPVSADVPEGYAIVPKMMTLDFEAMEMIRCMTGEGATEDEFSECVLWVGETVDDDGKVDAYGLNIACNECLEEGSVSVIEFAKPAVTGTGDGIDIDIDYLALGVANTISAIGLQDCIGGTTQYVARIQLCVVDAINKALVAATPAKEDEQASVPDAEYTRVLQDACDIIHADANTEENYASLCRIGAVLVKLRAGQEQGQ